MSVLVERLEDMSASGRLRLLQQGDGDVIISIQQEDGQSADVEFCSPGSGGGGSPKTWVALRQLIQAMKEDNEDPRATHRRVGDKGEPHRG
jgi:hypothetical protein